MASNKKKIKAAVIGVGNMGRHHARIYSNLEGVELVAVSDVNKKAEEIAKSYGCKFYLDYNKMLDKEKIDVVSVVVPTKLHKKIALDCIKL